MKTHAERGQMLVLFAGALVALLLLSALAVDLASVYATQQAEKAAADAAALAGAQDLQVKHSRALGDPVKARQHALDDLAGRFGLPSSPDCSTYMDASGNIVDCPLSAGSVGTPYKVSISSPSQTPTSSDPKSIQVTVRNPSYQLWFARLVGQNGWNVGEASVAVIDNSHAYALETLRPPTGPSIPNVRDLYLNGNYLTVNVVNGDVGTNANMLYNGSGAILTLTPGYRMYYADPYNGPLWGSNPTANKLTSLIQDPGYVIPSPPPAPYTGHVGGTDTTGNCTAYATTLAATGSGYSPYVPVTAPGIPDMTNITCYHPGVYASGLTIANGTLGILEPGLYFFLDPGLSVQGSLIGGWAGGSQGVALVFEETKGVQFKGRTSGGGSGNFGIFLNAGGKLGTPPGTAPTAALDYNGAPIQTTTTPPVPMTVMVQRDMNCLFTTGDSIQWTLPAACTNHEENQNIAISLAGESALYLGGVQFGPTDNWTVAGGTSNIGYVGQLISWTTQYTGNSSVNQEGLVQPAAGIMRLDTVCSGPGTACTHP